MDKVSQIGIDKIMLAQEKCMERRRKKPHQNHRKEKNLHTCTRAQTCTPADVQPTKLELFGVLAVTVAYHCLLFK